MTTRLDRALAAARALTPDEQMYLLEAISLDMLTDDAPNLSSIHELAIDYHVGGDHAEGRGRHCAESDHDRLPY